MIGRLVIVTALLASSATTEAKPRARTSKMSMRAPTVLSVERPARVEIRSHTAERHRPRAGAMLAKVGAGAVLGAGLGAMSGLETGYPKHNAALGAALGAAAGLYVHVKSVVEKR